MSVPFGKRSAAAVPPDTEQMGLALLMTHASGPSPLTFEVWRKIVVLPNSAQSRAMPIDPVRPSSQILSQNDSTGTFLA